MLPCVAIAVENSQESELNEKETFESINQEEEGEARVTKELRKSKRTTKEPTWLQEFSTDKKGRHK